MRMVYVCHAHGIVCVGVCYGGLKTSFFRFLTLFTFSLFLVFPCLSFCPLSKRSLTLSMKTNNFDSAIFVDNLLETNARALYLWRHFWQVFFCVFIHRAAYVRLWLSLLLKRRAQMVYLGDAEWHWLVCHCVRARVDNLCIQIYIYCGRIPRHAQTKPAKWYMINSWDLLYFCHYPTDRNLNFMFFRSPSIHTDRQIFIEIVCSLAFNLLSEQMNFDFINLPNCV